MPVVLYGCENWSLTFSEEPRLKLCENRVLRRIIGLKGDEVRREWRKLYIEELNELYFSLNIFRVIATGGMRWAGHIARMREYISVNRVSVGKPEEKRPPGKPRRRRDDNIMMDLQEV